MRQKTQRSNITKSHTSPCCGKSTPRVAGLYRCECGRSFSPSAEDFGRYADTTRHTPSEPLPGGGNWRQRIKDDDYGE